MNRSTSKVRARRFVSKRNRAGVLAAAALGGLSLLGPTRSARADNWFDVNGASTTPTLYGVVAGSTYSWDDPNWAPAVGGATATANWVQGSFARFLGGTGAAGVGGAAYTVTVNGDEQNIGLINGIASQGLTINAAGSGTLDVINGVQGIINSASDVTIISAPISGTGGGISPSGGGDIYLRGVNTYALGTTLSSSATLVHFNNNASFGASTGAMSVTLSNATGFVPLLAEGGASITIANPWTIVDGAAHNTGVNFAADANTPVNLTGDWTVPAALVSGFRIRNNGNATSPLTIAGKITGSTAGVTFSGANSGTIVLSSGANNYSGTTLIGVTGAASTTLAMGATNAIPIASPVSMIAGCKLDLNGFDLTVKSLVGAGTVAVGTKTFTISAPAGETFSGIISASAGGKAVKAGGGILFLTGASTTFNGEFDMTAGTLAIGNSSMFGNSSNTSSVVITGGILSNNGTGGKTIPAPISLGLNGNFTVDDSLSATQGQILFSGPATINNSNRTITVNGTSTNLGLSGGVGQDLPGRSLTKAGTGTLALTGANSYSGDTTILGGTININGTSTLGDGSGTFHLSGAGAKLNTTASRSVTSAAIPNPLDITADSFITTTSTANGVELNFSSSTVSASAGTTLTIRDDAPSGANPTFQPRFSGAFSFAGNITITNFGGAATNALTTLQSYNATGTAQTFSGAITGTGSFKRNASSPNTGGVTVFTGTNNFSGGAIIGDGVLRADEAMGLPTASLLTMSNGTWETGLNVTRALGTAADQVQITGGNSGFGAFGAPIFVNLGGVSSPITWGTGGFSPSILQLNAPTSNNTIDFQNPVDFAGITRSVFVGANVATLSGALTDAAATLGGITKVGSGTLVLSSTANTYDGATTVSAGTLQVATSNNLGSSTNIIALNGTATLQATGTLASGGRNVLVAGTTTGVTIDTNSNAVTVANIDGTGAFTKASTGTLLANHVRAGALTVSGGTLQIAADGTSAATSVVTGLTADTGKLDLNNNKLVVVAGNVGTWTGSAYDGITGRVASGRNNGTWDGNGVLTSQSNALLAQNYLTSLAVAKASDAKGLTAGQTATFGGQTVTDADVLVGYTYTGDANLSGSINADDYFQIDSNYNKSGTNFGWFNGDFNYDGVINGDDYAMIDSAFAAQGTPFSSGAPAGVSAVPEPAGALGALLICQVALAGRRRKPAR